MGPDKENPSEDFFDGLERKTDQLRSNGFPNGLIIIGGCLSDICYESSSFYRWQRFAEALSACKQRIRSFALTRIRKIPQEIFDLLLPALCDKNLLALKLVCCEMGSEGLLFAANLLRASPSMWKLSLEGSHFHDDSGDERLIAAFAELSRAIANHPLRELDFADCNLKEDQLSALLPEASNIERINFSNNPLLGTPNSCRAISRFLQSNPGTIELSLRGIRLQDEGAELLAQALRVNNRLEQLLLYNNRDITDSGIKALCNALFDSSSLNAAACSNHVCVVIDATGEANMARKLEINQYIAPSQSRREKIFTLLHNRTNHKLNLQHFTNLPLNFMPNALHLLMNDPDKKRRLSNVFEVLSWNTPLLMFASVISMRKKVKKSS